MKDRTNIKIICAMIITILTSGLISVSANSNLFSSNEVIYENNKSGLSSANVQGAVDELYAAATDYGNIDLRLKKIESSIDITKKYSSGLSNLVGSGGIFLYCNILICELKLNNFNPGTITNRVIIANVPDGYRPPTETLSTIYLNNSKHCTMGISGNGEVWLETGCSNSSIYISTTYPIYIK